MTYILDASHIFTLFFIMLGPAKLLVPYAQLTQSLDNDELRSLSVQTAMLATVIIVVGAYAGGILLSMWNLSVPVLMLAAGIIFFLVALRAVMSHVSDKANTSSHSTEPQPTAMQVIFPGILTPYGIAAAIILLATSHAIDRTLVVGGLILFVMFLDLLAMIFVRPLLKIITLQGMHIISAILNVLVVALALQIILVSLQLLDIIDVRLPPS